MTDVIHEDPKPEPGRPTACLIIIGNEILSGRTQDANLAFLGRELAEIGVPLREVRVIPDVVETIVETVNACRAAFTYVFTTGGIGPTHDDITAACIAQAFGVALLRDPRAVALLEAHYEPGQINEARLRMANIPEGASLIDNPVSRAPGFQIGNVFVMAGVPKIMQAMFDDIRPRLQGGPKVSSRAVSTMLGEGILAEGLGAVQARFPEVEIGSYPYFRVGQSGVTLVARGTDEALLDSVAEALRKLIRDLGGLVLETRPEERRVAGS